METDQLIPGRIINKRRIKRRLGSTGSRFITIILFGVLIYLTLKAVRVCSSSFGDEYYSFILKQRYSESHLFEGYLEALEENQARNWSEIYTSQPHIAGTNYGLVEFTKNKFEEFGLKSYIKTYQVYLNFPNDHALKLLDHNQRVAYEAPLQEDSILNDTTSFGDDLIPTFHGYSANGNVTAKFFYANYGRKQDFDKLDSLNVIMEGKIAIVRYGEIYRGLKVKFAQEHGAIGVLIYSDPGDDGELTPANGFEQYPNGPARHESSVQRGSVMYLSSAPGDPTTPGYASLDGVERVDPHHSTPMIPSLPISYREVTPILAKLNGIGLKAADLGNDWVGALPGFDYNIGPSKMYKLNLFNDQIYNITPIWNVLGEIEGILKDEAIIIGNHRDAWIKGGAGDPNSGSASMLEVIRGLNELQKKGWKPLRSIVFASWDAEEPGLVGSTEFAEDMSLLLQKKVIAYFNLDASVTGTHLHLSASPLLHNLLRETAKLISYPGGGSLYDHYKEEKNEKIDILGSGSDYCAFLQHLGIPSFDIGFENSDTDPIYQYHSNYDSFFWMDRLTDPGFVYHNVLSKYLGLLIIRLSERELIDFKVQDYSSDIASFFKEALSDIPHSWLEKEIITDNVDSDATFMKGITSVYTSYSRRVFGFWSLKVGGINSLTEKKTFDKNPKRTLQALINHTSKSLKRFNDISIEYDNYSRGLQFEYDNSQDSTIWKKIKLLTKIKIANLKYKYFERNFLHQSGLIGRSWYKHMIYASGRYTGYAGQTLPGLKEAIEDNDFKHAVYWINVLQKAVKRISIALDM